MADNSEARKELQLKKTPSSYEVCTCGYIYDMNVRACVVCIYLGVYMGVSVGVYLCVGVCVGVWGYLCVPVCLWLILHHHPSHAIAIGLEKDDSIGHGAQ